MISVDSSLPSWLTRERLVLAGLLLITAVVRGGALWAMRDNLQQDPDAYREIAENVLQHGVYGRGQDGKPKPTAYRPPLYPIVLSNLPAAGGQQISLWKVAVLHVLLGVATVWLTYLTARRMLVSAVNEPVESREGTPRRALPTAPLVAACLVACDPILLNQQSLVMTETLATFLAILSLWCLARFSGHRYWWNAALAGGTIGLAALCRPTFLPWLALVGVAMISDFRFQIADWRRWLGRTAPNFIALIVAAAAAMSPWAIRNQQEFGRPILTTTHGGYTLWLGNNPSFYEWLQEGKSDLPWAVDRDWDLTALEKRSFYLQVIELDLPSEMALDQAFVTAASQNIREDLGGFMRACFYRIRQLWSPLPHKLTADESTGRMLLRYATALWYCAVYLVVAVGVWRLRWRLVRQPWIWGVLLCLAFAAVHTFYWSNLRMRAPLIPFIAIVAAAGAMPKGRFAAG